MDNFRTKVPTPGSWLPVPGLFPRLAHGGAQLQGTHARPALHRGAGSVQDPLQVGFSFRKRSFFVCDHSFT